MRGGRRVTFNRRRVIRLLRRASYAWQNRLLAFAMMEPPEIWHLVPGIELGTRLHAIAVFWAGYFSRSGKLADDVIPRAYELVSKHPELSDPERMKEEFSDDDRAILAELIAFAKERPERIDDYITSLKTLRDVYDGDPRNIFLTLPKVRSLMAARAILVERLSGKQFPGVGQKIAQLITIWFQDVSWQEESDCPDVAKKWQWVRKIPAFPIDIWIMRLARQFDLIESWTSDHRDPVSEQISEYFSEICLQFKIPWSLAAQALWHAGARLCGRSRWKGNVEKSIFCKTRCPFFGFCRGIVKTNSETRSRGTLGWEELFVEHCREFPQPELDLKIPDNTGILYLPANGKKIERVTTKVSGGMQFGLWDDS